MSQKPSTGTPASCVSRTSHPTASRAIVIGRRFVFCFTDYARGPSHVGYVEPEMFLTFLLRGVNRWGNRWFRPFSAGRPQGATLDIEAIEPTTELCVIARDRASLRGVHVAESITSRVLQAEPGTRWE